VEALDERVVLSATVPNLQGDALAVVPNGYLGSTRTLTITSERDNGDGTGTFTGRIADPYFSANVTGTIAFSYEKSTYFSGGYFGWGTPSTSDFELNFSGTGTYSSRTQVPVQGGGDFRCSTVSSDPSSYAAPSSYWSFSGWENDGVMPSGPVMPSGGW
jgi:hypothetical protein